MEDSGLAVKSVLLFHYKQAVLPIFDKYVKVGEILCREELTPSTASFSMSIAAPPPPPRHDENVEEEETKFKLFKDSKLPNFFFVREDRLLGNRQSDDGRFALAELSSTLLKK